MAKLRHLMSILALSAASAFAGGTAHATIPVINLAPPAGAHHTMARRTIAYETGAYHAALPRSARPALSAGMVAGTVTDPALVAKIQERLNSDGAGLRVDGILGQRTMTALLNWQSAHGLKPTGALDRVTETILHVT
ncbi:MAG: peptidoglycan-binding domain-containing protein [Alphaproteobacteria bacterium]